MEQGMYPIAGTGKRNMQASKRQISFMRCKAVVLTVAFSFSLTVTANADQSRTDPSNENTLVGNQAAATGNSDASIAPPDYREFYARIIAGKVKLSAIKRSLSDPDPAALSNTLHALYAMRWHRGVLHLLEGIWREDRKKYPGLAWEHLSRAPARIALACTLNRIRIVNTGDFQDYIRAHKHDAHEFVIAQVVIALGLNGDPRDLPYLQEKADGDNHYVAQSAITAIAMAGGPQSQTVLEVLAKKHADTPRGDMIRELLRSAYKPRSPVDSAS